VNVREIGDWTVRNIMRWTVPVAHREERRGVYGFLVGIPEGIRPLG
jgi:hypothetical protein